MHHRLVCCDDTKRATLSHWGLPCVPRTVALHIATTTGVGSKQRNSNHRGLCCPRWRMPKQQVILRRQAYDPRFVLRSCRPALYFADTLKCTCDSNAAGSSSPLMRQMQRQQQQDISWLAGLRQHHQEHLRGHDKVQQSFLCSSFVSLKSHFSLCPVQTHTGKLRSQWPGNTHATCDNLCKRNCCFLLAYICVYLFPAGHVRSDGQSAQYRSDAAAGSSRS